MAVIAVFNPARGQTWPYRIKWEGRDYQMKTVGLCHPVWEGRTLHHVFSLSDGQSYFRLDFNTQSLQWVLKEVSDGLPG